jgi:hypothetical protein
MLRAVAGILCFCGGAYLFVDGLAALVRAEVDRPAPPMPRAPAPGWGHA